MYAREAYCKDVHVVYRSMIHYVAECDLFVSFFSFSKSISAHFPTVLCIQIAYTSTHAFIHMPRYTRSRKNIHVCRSDMQILVGSLLMQRFSDWVDEEEEEEEAGEGEGREEGSSDFHAMEGGELDPLDKEEKYDNVNSDKESTA